MEELDEFKDLWTTEKENNYIEIIDDIYYIMDNNKMMLLIEDEDIYVKLVKKMIENGVKVIKRNNETGEFRTELPHVALQNFNVIQRENGNVRLKIRWSSTTPKNKQLLHLKRICNSLSQISITDLYKMTEGKNDEWVFEELPLKDAKAFSDMAKKEGLQIEIVE